MSKRRIKKKLDQSIRRRRQKRDRSISPREVLEASLNEKRFVRRQEEDKVLAELIDENIFNLDKMYDYQYVLEFSKEIGWTPHKFNKTLERFRVRAKQLEKFIENNNSSNN